MAGDLGIGPDDSRHHAGPRHWPAQEIEKGARKRLKSAVKPTCSALVHLLLRRTGLILMATGWLLLSFFGRTQVPGFLPAGQIAKQTPVEIVYAIPSPFQPVQFHQLRLSGFACWFAKFIGMASIEPSLLSLQTVLGPGQTLLASASFEFLNSWQFNRRAALHPRAPCQT